MNSYSDEPNGATNTFHSNLAVGLHALAQPLAILRAKLYLESVSRMDSEELRQLAIDSSGQVERLCTLFNYLQEIVLAETSEPHPAMLNVREVLENTADGIELWFRDAGITLLLAHVDAAAQMYADKQRIAQAISSLLVLARELSTAGDTVLVSIISDSDGIEVLIANSASEIANLKAEAQLALGLVETSMRKQHGLFSYSVQPLELRIRVPKAPINN